MPLDRISYAQNEQTRIWRVTVNGRTLGDSRGYLTEQQAEQAARKFAEIDPDCRVFIPRA